MAKQNFDIDLVMDRVREAVEPFPKAALFELFDDGYTSPFEQLVACMISIRTRDETTLPLGRALFERARTPAAMLELKEEEIEDIIHSSTFSERKAGQILEMSRRLVDEYEGELPCDVEIIKSFSGVGVKCANLTVGIACGKPRVSADVHVHRVTNRWGYVTTGSPDATVRALEDELPEKYWVEINRLLVPFGKHICTGRRPKCSTCPVLSMCEQVGVINPR